MPSVHVFPFTLFFVFALVFVFGFAFDLAFGMSHGLALSLNQGHILILPWSESGLYFCLKPYKGFMQNCPSAQYLATA